ncbi:response regulator [Alkalihalobacillus hemicellulosilyticus]|nr:response regulator [Halalkalibacter hemicellulosilyticus]
MMIKMLIVDDEPIICQGLATTIEWDTLGIDLIGMAHDGQEALPFLERGVDLILTDVCMEEMDGLELSKYVCEHFPSTKIVMISGYDEFQYARQAIRLGVEDYLLKPVNIDELVDLTTKLKQEIIEKQRLTQAEQPKRISEYVMHQLFNTPFSSSVAEKKQLLTSPYRLMITECVDYHYLLEVLSKDELDQFKHDFRVSLDEMLTEFEVEHVTFSGHENEWVTVCYCHDEHLLDLSQFQQLCDKLQKKLAHPIRFGISNLEMELSNVLRVYEQVSDLLTEGRSENTLLFSVQIQRSKKKELSYPKEAEAQLRQVIMAGDDSLLQETVDQLFLMWQEQGVILEQVLYTCREMELMLKSRIKELTSSSKMAQVTFHLQERVDLQIVNSMSAMKRLFIGDLRCLLQCITHHEGENWMMVQIQDYINKHFQLDLKASDIAEKHFITPNYFSVLFKQETGKSFSEYVNSLRIRKASELLSETSNKVFEIAEYVGYKEYKYFVQVFKKHVGVTPTQFRRMHANK